MEPKDLILNVIGSLYDIVKCCYGINGQYQMLVSEDDSTNNIHKNDSNIILSKKASEILKSIKIEHVFSNIVKKSVQMLETICYDCTNTLILLIYSLFRECVLIMEKGIHPISLIYSLQNSFTTIIEPTLKSIRIPLIPTLKDIDTIENEEILKIKLKDIELSLLYKTIYSVINTKLENSTIANLNSDSIGNGSCIIENLVVSNISNLCLETIKTLYTNNKELTIKDIMNNRISFQDQVLIYPKLIKNNDFSNSDLISNFLPNTFIIDNNDNDNNNNNNSIKILKQFYNKSNNNTNNNNNNNNKLILFINEDLKLKSSENNNNNESLNKMDENEKKKEKTKLIFHTAEERTQLLEHEKFIVKNKIFKICKYLEKIIELNNNDNNNSDSNNNNNNNNINSYLVVLVFKSIDDYSKSIFYNNNNIQYLIFNSLNQQNNKIILKSFNINYINSIDSILTKEGLDNLEFLKKFEKNFIGKFKSIQYKSFSNQFEFSELLNTVSPIISIEIFASSNHILRQRVGSYVTGMGIGKCCLEDLFILPSAVSPEFSIINKLKQQQQKQQELSFIDKQVYEALIKSIETIPITLLSNQNKPVLKILDLFYKQQQQQQQKEESISIDNSCIGININSNDENNSSYFLNPIDNGIFETFRGKIQVFRFSIDIVCLLLKIDQIIQPQYPSQSQQQQQKQQQQQPTKREYIEFKQPEIQTDAIDKEKIEKTKKQNEIFYSKEEIDKRARFDKKFNTNPFSK